MILDIKKKGSRKGAKNTEREVKALRLSALG